MTVLRSTLCIAVGGPVLAWHALRLAAQLAGGLLGLLLAGCHVAGERALFGNDSSTRKGAIT